MKALARELTAKLGLPLSHFSRSELRRYVLAAVRIFIDDPEDGA